MNCMELRRALATSPAEVPREAQEHLALCGVCRAHLERSARAERTLRQALRFPVPEGLEAHILMAQSFQRRDELRRSRRRMLALAASVLLAVGVAIGVGWPMVRQAQLEDEVLALVDAAGYALESTSAVSDTSVSRALEPVGFRADPSLGPVSFAGRCLVRGILAGHLVLRPDAGPVTVFLVPGLSLAGTSRFGNATWSGVMLPARPASAIVVVAAAGVDVAPLASRVAERVVAPT